MMKAQTRVWDLMIHALTLLRNNLMWDTWPLDSPEEAKLHYEPNRIEQQLELYLSFFPRARRVKSGGHRRVSILDGHNVDEEAWCVNIFL